MKKILFVTLVIVWMSVIFYLSSQSGYESHQASKVVVNKVHSYVEVGLDKNIDIEKLNFYFRKNAHFAEFAFLAFLVYFLLKSFKLRYKGFISFLICLIFAISDEVHQMYTPNRTPSVVDVYIDISGAILMLFAIFVFQRIIGRVTTK
jgi:VanZ family protein